MCRVEGTEVMSEQLSAVFTTNIWLVLCEFYFLHIVWYVDRLSRNDTALSLAYIIALKETQLNGI